MNSELPPDHFLRKPNIRRPLGPTVGHNPAAQDQITETFYPPGVNPPVSNRPNMNHEEHVEQKVETPIEPPKLEEIIQRPYQTPNAFERPKDITEKTSVMGEQHLPQKESVVNGNPLRGYFRTPGLFIKLPSLGYYHLNKPDVAVNGTIPIYQMSAQEELLSRSPDAILSGFAVENIVKSCAPSIKDEVRNIPAADVDAILLAVQIATYGDAQEMTVECEKCHHNNEVEISRRRALDSMSFMPPETLVDLGDGLVAAIKPYTYSHIVNLSLATFEEHRRLQLVDNDKAISQEEKMNVMNASMMRLTKLAINMNSESILYVRTPDGNMVTDKKFINEFMVNADRKLTSTIEKAITDLNSTGINRKIVVDCSECKHENHSEFTADLLVPFSNAS